MTDTLNIENLRRAAKGLRKAFELGDADAMARAQAVLPDAKRLRHADALHVIAREAGFDSWPRLKFAAEAAAMDEAQKAERLKMALFHGQIHVIEKLIQDTPRLVRSTFGIMCALYDVDGVRAALARDPSLAVTPVGPRRPILHLTLSRWRHGPGRDADMFAVAEMLVAAGADVNDSYDSGQGVLSALYGAVSHAKSLELMAWLLTRGATPNDGESLYHACEFGHAEGLRLLLAHGAQTDRTNALPRALDFNNTEMVQVLLDAGADPNEGINWPADSGEPPWVIPALHQAGRRMCDPQIARLLLQAGADTDAVVWGHTAYALALVYGNQPVADEIARFGGNTDLTREEAILAAAVAGAPITARVDPEQLAPRTRDIVRETLHLPGGLQRIKRLIAAGMEFDRPDPQGLTPVQIAGWEGLPQIVEYLLSLGPDLTHVNGYGGTLLSTVIHGSENAGPRPGQDHIACARLVLEAGVDLPQAVIAFAGASDMTAFLEDWAEAHPEQVTETPSK